MKKVLYLILLLFASNLYALDIHMDKIYDFRFFDGENDKIMQMYFDEPNSFLMLDVSPKETDTESAGFLINGNYFISGENIILHVTQMGEINMNLEPLSGMKMNVVQLFHVSFSDENSLHIYDVDVPEFVLKFNLIDR